jgi:hypothetical protein
VLLAPNPTGDLAVRNVADEDVPERVLRLAGDRRAPLTPNELVTLESVEAPLASSPGVTHTVVCR